MTEPNTIKCRNCGKTNLKVYEDGSGLCLDCNDSFANINDYDQNKKEIATSKDNIFTKNNSQPVVSRWKNPFKDSYFIGYSTHQHKLYNHPALHHSHKSQLREAHHFHNRFFQYLL